MQEVIAQGTFEQKEERSVSGEPAMSLAGGDEFYVEVPKRCLSDYIQRVASGVIKELGNMKVEGMDDMTKKKHFAMIHSLVVAAEFITASDIKFGFQIPIQSKGHDEELAEVCEINNKLLDKAAIALGYLEPTEDA